MDIEIYQNNEYVTTCYDIADNEQGVFEFLCNFCDGEGCSIGAIEQESLSECAQELSAGEAVFLCGFELKRCD